MAPFKASKKSGNKHLKLGMRLGTLVVGGLALTGFAYGTGIWQDAYDETMDVEAFQSPSNSGDWSRNLAITDAGIDTCRTKIDQADICAGYGGDACKKLAPADAWMLLFVVLGLLYLFVGIAIVCDELFVPALERIAEEMDLSNDVAGATLMAAGGSAPELATSFVGTFKRSDVGFGTIVGSAVFNVLFVIGMCVMFTPEKYAPLELTWWPLFRDCTYYVVTLAFLAGFMYDGKIHWWEALIQFALYFGYVFMMAYSEQLEKYLSDKFASKVSPTAADALDKDGLDDAIENGAAPGSGKNSVDGADKPKIDASFVKPSTFRVGILQLLTAKTSLVETAGVAFVAQIKGDVNVVFDRIDSNQNGEIDKSELKTCLEQLGTPEDQLTDAKIDEVMASIDKNGNGFATKPDFTLWYLGNEQRLKNKTREIFDKYDTDGKNAISRDDVLAFMIDLGHNAADVKIAIEEAVSKIVSTGPDGFLTYEDFTTWYFESLFWDNEKSAAEQAVENQDSMFEGMIGGLTSDLWDPEYPMSSKVSFVVTLPLTLLFCLIPDCRPLGQEKWAAASLVASVIMIALFAIVMVELAEIFGATLGIPPVVMGLTILAAGTSVPDLLSSVIVAQQGHGDMAVSSSIGSNIFDVAFGLPLPWLVFSMVTANNDCNCGVEVEADGLFSSLLTLLVMVGLIVAVIHMSGWKMTHALGYTMFAGYFAYVIFALLMQGKTAWEIEHCAPFNLFGSDTDDEA